MKRSLLAGVLAGTLATFGAMAPPALADRDHGRDPIAEFERAVSTKDMVKTLRRLDKIADRNDDTRTSGTPGYDQSARFVAKAARKAGYDVTVQEFEFEFFAETATPELDRVSPNPTTYAPDTDFVTMDYSGSGDVTATVTEVDLALGTTEWPNAPATSTSGCEESDFTGFPAGNIALLQRGTCTFFDKALNAQNGGAGGVIIMNQGNDPGRTGLLAGTLGGSGVTIPTTGISFDPLGLDLANDPEPLTMHMFTETFIEARTTSNILAESGTGDPDTTVMVGAHLDSVVDGPGIQDNGSGSALVLELARELADEYDIEGDHKGKGRHRGDELEHRVRFAWWGAEESGLIGSDHYVFGLPPEELAQIGLYLNYDMVASPNFVRFIYDGDGSEFGLVGPSGSAEIEAMYEESFGSKGLATEPSAFDGRSDYLAFIDNDIPAGGLFTGAEVAKTPEQEAIYGGTAGVPYDPCYHQPCDDITNITRNSKVVLEQNGNAAADVLLSLLLSETLPG